jgi:hypothetical protein
VGRGIDEVINNEVDEKIKDAARPAEGLCEGPFELAANAPVRRTVEAPAGDALVDGQVKTWRVCEDEVDIGEEIAGKEGGQGVGEGGDDEVDEMNDEEIDEEIDDEIDGGGDGAPLRKATQLSTPLNLQSDNPRLNRRSSWTASNLS